MFWDWVFVVSFAIILSASTGIRAFLPLTITALLAKFDLLSVKSFYTIPFMDFVTDDRVLAFLVIATLIEIISDKIPAVDNFLDGVYSFIKPVISFMSVYGIMCFHFEPWQVAVISITMSFISAGVSTAKGGVRLASTGSTIGVANPFISAFEDILVLVKMILSMIFSWLLPIVAFLVVVTLILTVIWFFKIGKNVFSRSKLSKVDQRII